MEVTMDFAEEPEEYLSTIIKVEPEEIEEYDDGYIQFEVEEEMVESQPGFQIKMEFSEEMLPMSPVDNEYTLVLPEPVDTSEPVVTSKPKSRPRQYKRRKHQAAKSKVVKTKERLKVKMQVKRKPRTVTSRKKDVTKLLLKSCKPCFVRLDRTEVSNYFIKRTSQRRTSNDSKKVETSTRVSDSVVEETTLHLEHTTDSDSDSSMETTVNADISEKLILNINDLISEFSAINNAKKCANISPKKSEQTTHVKNNYSNRSLLKNKVESDISSVKSEISPKICVDNSKISSYKPKITPGISSLKNTRQPISYSITSDALKSIVLSPYAHFQNVESNVNKPISCSKNQVCDFPKYNCKSPKISRNRNKQKLNKVPYSTRLRNKSKISSKKQNINSISTNIIEGDSEVNKSIISPSEVISHSHNTQSCIQNSNISPDLEIVSYSKNKQCVDEQISKISPDINLEIVKSSKNSQNVLEKSKISSEIEIKIIKSNKLQTKRKHINSENEFEIVKKLKLNENIEIKKLNKKILPSANLSIQDNINILQNLITRNGEPGCNYMSSIPETSKKVPEIPKKVATSKKVPEIPKKVTTSKKVIYNPTAEKMNIKLKEVKIEIEKMDEIENMVKNLKTYKKIPKIKKRIMKLKKRKMNIKTKFLPLRQSKDDKLEVISEKQEPLCKQYCPVCDVNVLNLNKHVKIMHNNELGITLHYQSYSCCNCYAHMKTYYKLLQHIPNCIKTNGFINEPPFFEGQNVCEYCGRQILIKTIPENLTLHYHYCHFRKIQLITKDHNYWFNKKQLTYPCLYCYQKFSTKIHLLEHINTLCENVIKFNNHEIKTEIMDTLDCNIKQIPKILHNIVNCRLCHNKFSVKGLYQHRCTKIYPIVPKFLHNCYICFKMYSFNRSLFNIHYASCKYHVKRAKNYKCCNCHSFYKSNEKMLAHKKTCCQHQCSYCKKYYSTSHYLKTHSLKCKLKPQYVPLMFICEICKKNYISRKLLMNHFKSECKLECVKCKKSYDTKKLLEEHEIKCLLGLTYIRNSLGFHCNCGTNFITQVEFNNHKKICIIRDYNNTNLVEIDGIITDFENDVIENFIVKKKNIRRSNVKSGPKLKNCRKNYYRERRIRLKKRNTKNVEMLENLNQNQELLTHIDSVQSIENTNTNTVEYNYDSCCSDSTLNNVESIIIDSTLNNVESIIIDDVESTYYVNTDVKYVQNEFILGLTGKGMELIEISTSYSLLSETNMNTSVNKESNVDSDVKSNVDSDVTSNVDADIIFNVDSDVKSNVYSDVTSNVDSDVKSNVDSDVTSNVNADIIFNVDSDVKSNVDSDVTSTVNADIICNVDSDVTSNVNSDVKSNVNSDVKSNVDTDVKSNVDSDVKSNVDINVKSNVDSDVKSNVDYIVKSNVDSDVKSNLDSDIKSNVESTSCSDIGEIVIVKNSETEDDLFSSLAFNSENMDYFDNSELDSALLESDVDSTFNLSTKSIELDAKSTICEKSSNNTENSVLSVNEILVNLDADLSLKNMQPIKNSTLDSTLLLKDYENNTLKNNILIKNHVDLSTKIVDHNNTLLSENKITSTLNNVETGVDLEVTGMDIVEDSTLIVKNKTSIQNDIDSIGNRQNIVEKSLLFEKETNNSVNHVENKINVEPCVVLNNAKTTENSKFSSDITVINSSINVPNNSTLFENDKNSVVKSVTNKNYVDSIVNDSTLYKNDANPDECCTPDNASILKEIFNSKKHLKNLQLQLVTLVDWKGD